MTIDQRAWATEIAEGYHAEEDRAVTIHRAGQMTVAGYYRLDNYYRLDKADPRHINGGYRVRTRLGSKKFECIGTDDNGYLVRAEMTDADIKGLRLHEHAMAPLDLPFLRLVDDLTGFALPDSRLCSSARPTLMDVPPLDTSHAPEPQRAEGQDEEADQQPT